MAAGAVLGLDLGSVTVRGLLLADGADRPSWTGARPVRGQLAAVVDELLAELDPGLVVRLQATGVGRMWLAHRAPVQLHNEVVCLAEAAARLCPQVRTLIEIGGQVSRWVSLGSRGTVEDFSLSEACAAGSGAFLEQQASRLQMSVAEMGATAAASKRAAPVAGRCTVFAKSDMIHLQQKGVPIDEIAAGLCRAVARNFMATLLKGRVTPSPVALVGGSAANPGLGRAFAETLGLPEPPLVPPMHDYLGAFGAALLARPGQPELRVGDLRLRLRHHQSESMPEPRLAALRPVSLESGEMAPEPIYTGGGPVEGYLGIDVGSVSTNFVVLEPSGDVIDSIYLPTRGRPLEVLAEGLQLLRQRFGEKLRVLGAGTTGSGRHLAAAVLGADVVHNEITCQLESALAVAPDCDTVIEIGGQDSKFIRAARGGRLLDFTMNKICAAGTGSFLEEEAQRLGVSVMGEFAELALRSERPVDLGARCTVFMDTELVQAQARKMPVADLCAGLAYAVSRNYLDRVVEGRSIGEVVVMQGGVASNRAVVSAFAQLLGRAPRVHPHNRISGAIGAARMARQAQPRRSTFRGLQALCGGARVRTFECPQCENRCQVSDVVVEPRMPSSGSDARRAHFGDACERYTARDRPRAGRADLPDLFAERDRRLRSGISELERPRAVLGLPLASCLLEQVPFWATFLRELRLGVRLSAPSSSRTLEAGAAHLPAETCLPVKLAFGHVRELLQAGVDAIFVPSLIRSTDWEGDSAPVCPYVQTLPFMLAATLQERQLVAPEVCLGGSLPDLVAGLLPTLARFGVKAAEIRSALPAATAAQRGFRVRLRARGAEVLKRWPQQPRLAVLGRPYTLADAFLNLNLGRHLQRLGVLALPLEFVPLRDIGHGEGGGRSSGDFAAELARMPWRYNRDLMRALEAVLADPSVHPVIVGSYGCGPHAFAQKHFSRRLRGRAHLELEFDEHRGEAGLITRLEAFLDEIAARYDSARESAAPPASLPRPLENRRHRCRGRRVFVSHYADHAHAFVGALRAGGLDARLLPVPDRALEERAQRCSAGNECHPYTLLAADLDRLADEHQHGDVYFMPGVTIPCLIQQYGDAMQILLENRSVTGIDLLSPDLDGYTELCGYGGALELYKGLLAIDLLVRASCRLRPYELVAGSCDRAHAINLHEVQEGLANGALDEALQRCLQRLARLAVDRVGPRRPRVGVAGDIYTRINSAANRRLFWVLEELGCEVWPAPFLVDIVRYGVTEKLRQSLHNRQLPRILRNAVLGVWLERATRKVESVLAPTGAQWDEPDLDSCLELAAPYIGRHTIDLLQWNIGKMVHFARGGAHGIINAAGQNCMLGTISASVTRRLRADHDQIPLVTLFYGGSASDTVRASLEAFTHQVRRWAAERPGGPASPRSRTTRGSAAAVPLPRFARTPSPSPGFTPDCGRPAAGIRMAGAGIASASGSRAASPLTGTVLYCSNRKPPRTPGAGD